MGEGEGGEPFNLNRKVSIVMALSTTFTQCALDQCCETAIGLPVIALKTDNRFENFKTDY